jgi:glycosyltransferase involved in cell wall biosynthesis
MKVLAVTNLFPNSREPGRGIFNRQQFRELAKLCELRVVAPLPWVPPFWGSVHRKVADREVIDGLDVYHPRHLVTPKTGRRFYGLWYYQSIRPVVLDLRREFRFDLIFATWAYPDCYGASALAAEIPVPLVARVHGTDINEGARHPARRALMKLAFDRAKAVVANSAELKSGVAALGIPEEKISVIPNGVDPELFKPLDRGQCRRQLNWGPDKQHILFIGNLVAVKGVSYLLKALTRMRAENPVLHVVGSGNLEAALRREAAALGLGDSVIFHGRQPHQDIARWLAAADALCLPSINEGSPNVILEALACGTPVAASRTGGIPDLVDSPDKGRLFRPEDPQAIATAVKEVLDQNRRGLRPDFKAAGWDSNARQMFEIFRKAVVL